MRVLSKYVGFNRYFLQMNQTVIRVKRGGHIWWPNWSNEKYFDIHLISSRTRFGVDIGVHTIVKTEHRQIMIHFGSDYTTTEATRLVIKLLHDGKFDVHEDQKYFNDYNRLCTHTKWTRSKHVKSSFKEILYD